MSFFGLIHLIKRFSNLDVIFSNVEYSRVLYTKPILNIFNYVFWNSFPNFLYTSNVDEIIMALMELLSSQTTLMHYYKIKCFHNSLISKTKRNNPSFKWSSRINIMNCPPANGKCGNVYILIWWIFKDGFHMFWYLTFTWFSYIKYPDTRYIVMCFQDHIEYIN